MDSSSFQDFLLSLPIQWHRTIKLRSDFSEYPFVQEDRIAEHPTYLDGVMIHWDWSRDSDTLDINADSAAPKIISGLNELVKQGIIKKYGESCYNIRPILLGYRNEGYSATTYNYVFEYRKGLRRRMKYIISVFHEKEKPNIEGGLGNYSTDLLSYTYIKNGAVRIQGYMMLMARLCDAYGKGKKRVFPYGFIFRFRLRYYISAFSISSFMFGMLMFLASLWNILIGKSESVGTLRGMMIIMILSLLIFVLLGGTMGFEEIQTNKGRIRGKSLESFYVRTGNSLPQRVHSKSCEDDDEFYT